MLTEGGFSKPPRAPITERDPISGVWTRRGVNLLDLSFDGDRGVTGDVMDGEPGRRADITRRGFDRVTGVLYVEGSGRNARTGEPHHYVIDGTLDDGELTVLATFGDRCGNLNLRKGSKS